MVTIRQRFGNWRKSIEGQFSISSLYRKQCFMCPSCQSPLSLKDAEVHHIIPIAVINSASISEAKKTFWATYEKNLILLCRTCNRKQGAKKDFRFIDEYLENFPNPHP